MIDRHRTGGTGPDTPSHFRSDDPSQFIGTARGTRARGSVFHILGRARQPGSSRCRSVSAEIGFIGGSQDPARIASRLRHLRAPDLAAVPCTGQEWF